jgi:Lamin Tail Domain
MFWRLALRGVSVAAALSVAVACAKGEDGIDLGAGGSSDPDAGVDAARLPSTDSGKGDSSTKEPGDDSGSGPGCTSKVVINEVMPEGPGGASDEFVELYNPNSCAVSLAGWRLAYISKSGAETPKTLYTFKAGDDIQAESYFVIGTAGFSGTKDATTAGGIAVDGQIGLLDDGDRLVDGLGYGAAVGEFVEGTAAPKPATNGSVGRKSDGLDTDNNASDCKAFSQHTAGAAN